VSLIDQTKERLRAIVAKFGGDHHPEILADTSVRRATQPGAALPNGVVLDCYVSAAPSPQNALDIFKGDWSSRLPKPFDQFKAGAIDLFRDARMTWMIEQIGGVQGQSVVELGPLEGGHTYMLHEAGASELVAIESNSRAFLKCLIVKELLGLHRARFLYGDFVEYLRSCPRRFDIALASGVLYHMRNPVELIALLARVTDRIFVWTHYYDSAIITASPALAPKFLSSAVAEYDGFEHTLYRQEYLDALCWSGFCGGSHADSAWMSRSDILSCVRYFGFQDIEIAFEAPDHPNGPSFAFLAQRARGTSL
jgi:hypothetical protein